MKLKRNKNKKAPKKFKYNFIWLILLIGLAAGAFAFAKYQSKPQVKTMDKPAETVVETKEDVPKCHYANSNLLVEINKVRSVPVVEDPRLSQIALERATEMNGTLDNHAGFKTRFYNSPLPYGYVYLGENLAFNIGCPDVNVVMGGWLSSPPHKATMLNPRYDRIGIAEYKGVIVNLFGDY